MKKAHRVFKSSHPVFQRFRINFGLKLKKAMMLLEMLHPPHALSKEAKPFVSPFFTAQRAWL
jgi:hypothetical protein